jgi:hypothetical protein
MIVEKKLKKIQNVRTDAPDMLAALDALSTFYRGNSVEARRSLRADLEHQSSKLSESFLDDFQDFKEKIEMVDAYVTDLEKSCTAIRTRLQTAEDTTSQFVSKAGSLRLERNEATKRAELVSAFLGKFQLSGEQLHTLREAPVEEEGGDHFFDALQRVHAVREECKLLLNSQHQSVGVELLNAMAEHQEVRL